MNLVELYWSLRKPNSVSTALKQILDNKEISRLESQGLTPGEIVEQIARDKNFDAYSLLLAVANLLDVAALEGDFFPDTDLMKQAGLSKEYLEEKNALICKCGEANVLLMSDLSKELTRISKKYSLQPCLGLISQIKQSYSNFNFAQNAISTSQLEQVFKKLVEDVSSIGAEYINLETDTGKYHFVINNESFEGNVHPLISKQAFKWLEGKSRVKVRLFAEKEVSFIRQEDDLLISWSNKSNNILFVEDDKLFATILKSTLQKNSYNVNCYHDAESALEDLQSGKIQPGMVISDMHLPGINGGEFLKEVKKIKPNLPFLVLTSDDKELTEVDLVLKGVGAYLKKNEDIRVILAWCGRLIGGYACN